MKTNITIMGLGTMGKAIVKILKKNDPTIKIFCIEKNQKIINEVKNSDFVILAIKPQDGKDAIQQLKSYGLNKNTILISIMAGFSIKRILNMSGHKKIIRMMPNLGLSIGVGIAAWKKVGLSKIETTKTQEFINKITENFEVKNEDTIDKVTAISGSGPAYFFLLADSLIKASEKFGFTKEESRKLVEKTFLASSLLGKDTDYSALIKRVASKKGTTEAALKIFKKENFYKIVSKAVLAGYKRAKELSK